MMACATPTASSKATAIVASTQGTTRRMPSPLLPLRFPPELLCTMYQYREDSITSENSILLRCWMNSTSPDALPPPVATLIGLTGYRSGEASLRAESAREDVVATFLK